MGAVEPPVLEVQGLCRSFDGVRAVDDVSCQVDRGEIVGLIGPNGAGKSTLFHLISGFLPADTGSIRIAGHRILGLPPDRVAELGLARTFQQVRLIRRLTVLENMLLAARQHPGERLHSLVLRYRAARAYEHTKHRQAQQLLEDFGLGGFANEPAGALSYGQQKLVSLVCCAAAEAALVLLDEPIAGVAPSLMDQTCSLIRSLATEHRAVMMVEHDVEAVARLCSRVIFMDTGRIICEGTAEEVRQDPRVIEAYLGAAS